MTFPNFTVDQPVYRNTRHYRSSSPIMRISGITISQCGNRFPPNGSYLRSCVGCTCNDHELSCYCYDPTRCGKPAKTGPIAVQVHLNDDGRVRAIERSCRAVLKRAATRSRAAFTLQGALPPGLSKNELQRRFARRRSHWIRTMRGRTRSLVGH